MKVLFVCLGNAFRSPVAEALLKKFKPEIEVDSAGVNPSIPISEAARNFLTRENAGQYLKPTPEGLNEKNLDDNDLIIVMEPRHKDAVLAGVQDANPKLLFGTSTILIFYHLDTQKRYSSRSKTRLQNSLTHCEKPMSKRSCFIWLRREENPLSLQRGLFRHRFSLRA